MKDKTIEKRTVIKKVEKMEKQIDDGEDIVWINFPYSESNLAVIRSSLKELGLCRDIRISFDENDIFIQKDNFLMENENANNY